MLLEIIFATTLVCLISLVSVVFVFRKNQETHHLKPLISLAAGSLLAVAFLDLLPEAMEQTQASFQPQFISSIILLSILGFFILERALHWHHCNEDDAEHVSKKHSIVWLNLIGDALHNVLDGVLIAASFLLDFNTGVLVTVAIILHEIPQEIFDFSILLYGGFSKLKAIFFNVLVSVTAMAGALAFYFFGAKIETFTPIMAAIAVGNFIYLAIADIIPELHHENKRATIVAHTLWLLAGVVVIYFINVTLPGVH